MQTVATLRQVVAVVAIHWMKSLSLRAFSTPSPPGMTRVSIPLTGSSVARAPAAEVGSGSFTVHSPRPLSAHTGSPVAEASVTW